MSAATPSSSAEMSVTYDDSVGVEVSSDSFWEVMPPLLMHADLRLLASSVPWWCWYSQEERNVTQNQLGTCCQMGCGGEEDPGF